MSKKKLIIAIVLIPVICVSTVICGALATPIILNLNRDYKSSIKTTSTTPDKCIGTEMSLKKADFLFISIDDKNAEPDTEKSLKNTYNNSELSGMKYGIIVKNNEKPVYVTYELCELEGNKPVTKADLSKKIPPYGAKDLNATVSIGGSTTNFTYANTSGEEILPLKSGKTYTINAFYSFADEDWHYGATKSFTVE